MRRPLLFVGASLLCAFFVCVGVNIAPRFQREEPPVPPDSSRLDELSQRLEELRKDTTATETAGKLHEEERKVAELQRRLQLLESAPRPEPPDQGPVLARLGEVEAENLRLRRAVEQLRRPEPELVRGNPAPMLPDEVRPPLKLSRAQLKWAKSLGGYQMLRQTRSDLQIVRELGGPEVWALTGEELPARLDARRQPPPGRCINRIDCQAHGVGFEGACTMIPAGD